MKPAPFTYLRPTSLAEALELRARHAAECVVLAGGQSLLPILNLRLAAPDVIIDIARIPDLSVLSADGEGLHIGATVRQRTAETSPLVAAHAPLLVEALRLVGYPSIRTRGTVGGSIAHADPVAELPSVALALGAEIQVASSGSTRRIAADDFFFGFMSTAVAPDEIVTAVHFPGAPAGRRTAIVEVARRHGDFALVGATVCLDVGAKGRIEAACVVVAGVAPVPHRAASVERELVGETIGAELLASAAARAADGTDPVEDVHASAGYRRHVARTVVGRALARAAEGNPAA